MRFHLDGQRIQGKHTPAEVRFVKKAANPTCRTAPDPAASQLEMEDNDSIDAFVAQVGGWALRVATAA